MTKSTRGVKWREFPWNYLILIINRKVKSVAKREGGNEAKTWGCTKKSEVIIVLCFGAQEQKQRRKKTEAIQSWAMSRWKQEKGKGQEDKAILRPEWPYIFLKNFICESYWGWTEIKNPILELNHGWGVGRILRKHIHAGRWRGVQRNALNSP